MYRFEKFCDDFNNDQFTKVQRLRIEIVRKSVEALKIVEFIVPKGNSVDLVQQKQKDPMTFGAPKIRPFRKAEDSRASSDIGLRIFFCLHDRPSFF